MNDISNRDLKEFLKDQNESLREFIKQTNTNIIHLNDNQIAHTQEITKLSNNLNVLTKFLNKYGGKLFWLLTILIAIILVMAGYDFVWEALA